MLPTLNDHLALIKLYQAEVNTGNAYERLNRSRIQTMYNRASEDEALVIGEISQSGDLALMLAAERQLQTYDLGVYAKTEREKNNVEEGLQEFERVLGNYEELIRRPAAYRRQAKHYSSRDMDKALDVPMDGMRRVLNSQAARLKNRMSLTLSDEEKILLVARLKLVAALRNEYALLQRQVVHNDNEKPTNATEA